MPFTLDELMEKTMSSLPEDYRIENGDDALIKAAFVAEELGEVVKAIAHGSGRDVVCECADAVVGLLQVMAFYNDGGPEGVESAFEATLGKLRDRKSASI